MKITQTSRTGTLKVKTAHENSTEIEIVVRYYDPPQEFQLELNESSLFAWVSSSELEDVKDHTLFDIECEFGVSRETALEICEALKEWK
ncbi:hypothetical protein MYO4S_00276 [Serratia phage 4S]|nr:hypothetical protein MYO4S_00276 [Serratia phage 4S]